MSNIIVEIPPIGEEDCYYLQERHKPSFNYPIHKHDAYELNFVEHCLGARRIVGDSIEELGEYDLALIGCNLEHVWEQHKCKSKMLHEITIQMPPEIAITMTLNKRVMAPVKEMMKIAPLGIAFGMKAIMTVYERLNIIATTAEPTFQTYQMLATVIYDLARTGDYHALASSHYSHATVPVSSRRIQKVKEYIDGHYMEEIRMEQLSSLVNMTPNALSRFFKHNTNRTISNYINEVRISHATQMLADSARSISEISYQCGFNTISNFNRMFKSVKGITPTHFRDIYKKNAYLL